ncbi:hypothetical protein BDQ17DRAFT_1542909 [Cyathus striatus]|nr:hypothetical protein BDQ17DRAFT_1542909 [Cyathus striatus]
MNFEAKQTSWSSLRRFSESTQPDGSSFGYWIDVLWLLLRGIHLTLLQIQIRLVTLLLWNMAMSFVTNTTPHTHKHPQTHKTLRPLSTLDLFLFSEFPTKRYQATSSTHKTVAEVTNARPLKQLRSKGPNDLPRHVELQRPIDLCTRDPQPFVCVSAVWRLATKYEIGIIGFLVKDSVSRFKTKYPMNFKYFYQRDFANKIVMTPGQHYDAIDLARKMNMLRILPSAFFLCWHNMNF